MMPPDETSPRPTRRQRLQRLGKLRILAAALIMLALGYGITLAVDLPRGKTPPEPHQILDQVH